MTRQFELFVLILLLRAAALEAHPERERAPRRPHLLIAIADDWSAGHASGEGCRWVQTPAYDRVAREGLRFTQAFTPNAKCAPSRACLLTGRNSWQLEAAANHVPYFPSHYKTFPEVLREHRYFTGYTAKGWAPGVAVDAAGQPRELTGRAFDRRTAVPPTRGISSHDYAANFVDFLDAVPDGQSWCFWYGSLEPHRGYESGSGETQGGKRLGDIDRVPGYWPDHETVRRDLLDYAFEVEHFDRHLGRMLEELDRRGLAHDTLVVVTSDHGMPFPRVKGQAYLASHHLPFALRWPAGIRHPGRLVSAPVSLIDLAPTLVDLAGLDWNHTGMAPAAGRSLRGFLTFTPNEPAPWTHRPILWGKERHDVGRPHDWGYPIRGILTGDFLYLHNFEPDRWPAGNPETGYLNCDGGATKSLILETRRTSGRDPFWDLCFGQRPREELYDLRRDPDCLANLAHQPDYQARRLNLQRQLFAELTAQDDPRMTGHGHRFDAYPYAQEAHRHFYERHQRGEPVVAGWVNATDFEAAPLNSPSLNPP